MRDQIKALLQFMADCPENCEYKANPSAIISNEKFIIRKEGKPDLEIAFKRSAAMAYAMVSAPFYLAMAPDEEKAFFAAFDAWVAQQASVQLFEPEDPTTRLSDWLA